MSSSRSGRPWTRGKASAGDGGGAGRPLTRGRQRGYYSEIVGAEAVKKIGGVSSLQSSCSRVLASIVD